MNRPLLPILTLATGIAALPEIGHAAEQTQIMNNCVSAYMQSLSRASVPVKLRESRLLPQAGTPALLPPSSSTLVLTARDANDKHTVGRAICRLGVHGEVMRIEEVRADSLPID